jgi:hypothetical protein
VIPTQYDPKHYSFERRSVGGYFDDGRRRRRRLVIAASIVLELMVAAVFVALVVTRS